MFCVSALLPALVAAQQPVFRGCRRPRLGAPDNPDRYAGLRKLLSMPGKPGANLVISSHGNPFHATAGAPYLAEGEAAVIRPLGKDFEIIARVKHDGWRALADN